MKHHASALSSEHIIRFPAASPGNIPQADTKRIPQSTAFLHRGYQSARPQCRSSLPRTSQTAKRYMIRYDLSDTDNGCGTGRRCTRGGCWASHLLERLEHRPAVRLPDLPRLFFSFLWPAAMQRPCTLCSYKASRSHTTRRAAA
jgi:hypothetical protein